jgi:nicotinamidase-related amidase
MIRALLIVDIQNDYFPGGRNPLEGPEGAAAHARELLDAFRASGEPLVHIQHAWDAPDAEYLQPGTPGFEINDAVQPAEGETVIRKENPTSFLDTPLEKHLRDQGVDSLVVCGMMTSMCVDATVRAAADLGFATTVVHDACATMPLEFGGRAVPAADVHTAFIAALGDGYAEVASTADVAATASR